MLDDAAILEAVAAQSESMIGLLEELVAAPTVLGHEAAGQDVMRRAFAGLGLTPVDVPLDAATLRAHHGASPFSWDVTGKANVVAAWEPAAPGGGRSLILNGHVDVVSPEPAALWSGDPYVARRDGEWLQGRGAGDMKAGLAAIVGAVAALRALGVAPLGRIELQSVVEEECTGNGALACVLAGDPADAAVITEPTGGAIWTGQVGVLWFQVRVLGEPGHAGLANGAGNAIDGAYAVMTALRGLEAELNAAPPPPFSEHPHPINFNVGVIRGGDWPSTLAGECVLHGRLATYPSETVAALRERVEAAVAAAPLAAGFWAELVYDGFACEGYAAGPDEPLALALAAAAQRVTGAAPARLASTATTDARSFHLYGATPAVCFGPVAESIHGIDERVHLPSVVTTAQAIAIFIRDWCGVTAC